MEEKFTSGIDPLTRVLDHGSIKLLHVMGGDIDIVNAARQSFGKRSDTLTKKDEGLINFLMRERHGTPFEMVQFMFQIKCPIFVARQWFRHRIGSFNELSGRYSKLPEEFYLPTPESVREQTGKPGNYTFIPVETDTAMMTIEQMHKAYKECWKTYKKLLDLNIAKELARAVLPVGIYTEFTWSVNLRSLFNFISLRSDPQCEYETRQYSKAIEHYIRVAAPIAFDAFKSNGNTAP